MFTERMADLRKEVCLRVQCTELEGVVGGVEVQCREVEEEGSEVEGENCNVEVVVVGTVMEVEGDWGRLEVEEEVVAGNEMVEVVTALVGEEEMVEVVSV